MTSIHLLSHPQPTQSLTLDTASALLDESSLYFGSSMLLSTLFKLPVTRLPRFRTPSYHRKVTNQKSWPPRDFTH